MPIVSAIKLKLLSSEKNFRTLFQLSPVGMAIVNAETGKFLDVNDAVLKSTGYTKVEFINLTYWQITPKKYEEQELQQIKDLQKTGTFGPNQKEYIRKDGTKYPISISGVALNDADGRKIVLGIIEDISERKAYEKKLKRLALYDPLTNIPNRRLLYDRLHQAVVQSDREKNLLAVLMLDLDRFKEVNDILGHDIGDKLLIEVAQRIKGVILRKSDTVARLGGDEFIILLPIISDKKDALYIAEKICNTLVKSFIIEGETINISASIGIAIFPEHGKDDRTLMMNADRALYQVKKAERNGFKLFENQ